MLEIVLNFAMVLSAFGIVLGLIPLVALLLFKYNIYNSDSEWNEEMGKVYTGDVYVTVKMRYAVDGLEVNDSNDLVSIKKALKDQLYYDIIDEEEIEIISVDSADLMLNDED